MIISLHVLPTLSVKQDAIVCLCGQVVLFAQGGPWTWCSPGPPCPYLQRGLPASWPPAWPGVWDYFSPAGGFGISFCRNSMTVSPFLQPVEGSLDGGMTLWPSSHSSQLCVTCRLAEDVLSHQPGQKRRSGKVLASVQGYSCYSLMSKRTSCH